MTERRTFYDGPTEREEVAVLQTYTLQLVGPPRHYPDGMLIGASVAWNALKETEENLTDLLPEGYSVKIREWDSDE